jgi:hypothetical protein
LELGSTRPPMGFFFRRHSMTSFIQTDTMPR